LEGLQGKYVKNTGLPCNPSKFWNNCKVYVKSDAGKFTPLKAHMTCVTRSPRSGWGVPLAIVGKALGHAQARTTERYTHLADNPVKQAVDAVGEEIKKVFREPAKVEEIGEG
jgi:integrase